jgi:hypothetical protein
LFPSAEFHRKASAGELEPQAVSQATMYWADGQDSP